MSGYLAAVLFSLKPTYANLVFEGVKRAELRTRVAPRVEDREVLVYVSSPIRALRGGFRVGEVWRGAPEEIWSIVSRFAGVNKRDFDNYYTGRDIAYALEITDVWEYDCPVDLHTLRRQVPGFVVPQSWRYIGDREYQYFERMAGARLGAGRMVAG